MNKIKNIFAFAIVTILIYSCGTSSTTPVDDFDYEAQALIDNDTLVKFLKHFHLLVLTKIPIRFNMISKLVKLSFIFKFRV